MTDTSETPTTKRPRRVRRWILIVSLTLNFFFVALAVGAAVKHWHGHGNPALGLGGHRGGPMAGMRKLVEGDFESHPELNALRERHVETLSTAMADARAARQAARAVLRDPERDPAALEAALLEIRRATRFFQQAMHETILDAAQTLPPEDFKTLMRGRRWHRD